MIAVSVRQPHELRVTEPDPPQVGAGEVLVRVLRAGICGADMHIFHGSNPFAEYSRVIGHEFAGEIVEVGRAGDLALAGDAGVRMMRVKPGPPDRTPHGGAQAPLPGRAGMLTAAYRLAEAGVGRRHAMTKN